MEGRSQASGSGAVQPRLPQQRSSSAKNPSKQVLFSLKLPLRRPPVLSSLLQSFTHLTEPPLALLSPSQVVFFRCATCADVF